MGEPISCAVMSSTGSFQPLVACREYGTVPLTTFYMSTSLLSLGFFRDVRGALDSCWVYLYLGVYRSLGGLRCPGGSRGHLIHHGTTFCIIQPWLELGPLELTHDTFFQTGGG